MKKLYNVLALVCVVLILAMAGLAAYLVASGRLDAESRKILGRWLRGGSLVEAAPVAKEDLADSTGRQAAGKQLAADRSREELTELLVDRRLAEVGYQQEQLAVLRKILDQQRHDLQASKDAWRRQVQAARDQTQDEAFVHQLKLFESLRAKQVRDILMDMDDEQATRFLAAMKRQTAADVMGQFKTEPQRQRLGSWLQNLREAG